MEERLHKVLAAAGVASRREAERLIAAGEVAIDGEIVTQMGVKVDPEQHTITVAGRPVALPRRKVYVLLNKPAGYVTTRSDPHASRTVMDLVREVSEAVHPVGRLDKDTQGALILTNDGEFTQVLTHPSHGVPKIYQAHVEGIPGEKALEQLRTGVRLEDGVTAPAYVRVLFAGDERSVLEITLHEGRKRQVRRMLDAVGHPVRHLRRVAIGPISVRGLPQGGWRYLAQKEVHALLRAATSEGKAPPGRAARPAAGTSPVPQPPAEGVRGNERPGPGMPAGAPATPGRAARPAPKAGRPPAGAGPRETPPERRQGMAGAAIRRPAGTAKPGTTRPAPRTGGAINAAGPRQAPPERREGGRPGGAGRPGGTAKPGPARGPAQGRAGGRPGAGKPGEAGSRPAERGLPRSANPRGTGAAKPRDARREAGGFRAAGGSKGQTPDAGRGGKAAGRPKGRPGGRGNARNP